MWKAWKTYPPQMWKTNELFIDLWKVWKTYPPELWKTWLGGRYHVKTKRSGNKRTKINKLSTLTVDNLVNKCVEVMKMYSDRKCLSGETYSHMRQQFIDAHYFTRAKGRCQMDMWVLGCIAVVHGANSAEHISAQLFAEAI